MRGNSADMIGKSFGKLTVVSCVGKNKHRQLMYECLCECGNKSVVVGNDLRSGHTTNCGCVRKQKLVERNYKHGGRYTRLYSIWRSMLNRCNNPKNINYKYYGGKGITVCDEWVRDFSVFQEWALSNGYVEGLTIDRINNNESYCPSNCHFITMFDQSRNKSTTHNITINGVQHCLTDWANIMGISEGTICTRIRRGWSEEVAVTTPVKHNNMT